MSGFPWLRSYPQIPGYPGLWEPLESPQEQLRLLYLLPGAQDEPINGELYTFYRETAPAYTAMSYSWGNAGDNEPLSINGITLSLRRSCHYVLWQARAHVGGSFIWIDSICIDQENLQEKGHQVRIMGSIYASADLVLVCIGPGTEDIDTITALAPELESCVLDPQDITRHIMKKSGTGAQGHETPTTRFMQRASSSGGIVFSKCFKQACQHFAGRPYWERLWVVQELMLSQEKVVLCGARAVAWQLVSNLISYNNGLHGPLALFDSATPLQHLGRVLQPLTHTEYFQFSILSLFKCFDPRDRVYGTLGFVDWSTLTRENVFYPDYSRSRVKLASMVLEMGLAQMQDPRDLFRMLGIDADDSEIRKMVSRRSGVNTRKSSGVGINWSQAWLPWTQSKELVSLHQLPVTIVKLEAFEDNLSAKFVLAAHLGGIDWYKELKYMLKICSNPDDLAQRLRKKPPRKVLCDNKIAALVCHEAVAGDYLIQLHAWQHESHCLVVRQGAPFHKRPYAGLADDQTIRGRIVGQALLLNHDLEVLSSQSATVTITMSRLDWVVWRVQDLRFVDPDHFSTSDFKENTRFKMERLLTPMPGEVDLFDHKLDVL